MSAALTLSGAVFGVSTLAGHVADDKAAAAAAKQAQMADVAETAAAARAFTGNIAHEVSSQRAQQKAAQLKAARDAAAKKAAARKAAAAKAAAAKKAAAEQARREAARQAAAKKAAARAARQRASRSSDRAPLATGDPRSIARSMVSARGWGSSQFSCLDSLWQKESGWRVSASNPSSGAYGIPQALPGSKMSSAGSDWRTNAATQIKWGLNYISSTYGTPCSAWSHSQANGWY